MELENQLVPIAIAGREKEKNSPPIGTTFKIQYSQFRFPQKCLMENVPIHLNFSGNILTHGCIGQKQCWDNVGTIFGLFACGFECGFVCCEFKGMDVCVGFG